MDQQKTCGDPTSCGDATSTEAELVVKDVVCLIALVGGGLLLFGIIYCNVINLWLTWRNNKYEYKKME